MNSHREHQVTDRTHDKRREKEISSLNSTSHYHRHDASPTNSNSSRTAGNAFQKNTKPLVSSKSQNDLKPPVQKTTPTTSKDTSLSRQQPGSRSKSPTPAHKKNDSGKSLSKPTGNSGNSSIIKEEAAGAKVINVKLNSSRLNESSISNKSARSTSPHHGKINGTPAYDKKKYSSKGSNPGKHKY